MKVLVISGAMPPMRFPEAAHSYLLCRHLADRGFDIHVLTSSASEQFAGEKFTVHRAMDDWTWNEASRLRAVVKQVEPDAILLVYLGSIYHRRSMVTFAPWICRGIRGGHRFVTQFENLEGNPCPLPMRIVRKLAATLFRTPNVDHRFGCLLGASAGIIALCQYHRDSLVARRRSVREKITIIPAPPIMCMTTRRVADCRNAVRSAYGLDETHFVVAYFGYVYPGKGIETLLKAFAIASGQLSNLRLMIIGGVPSRTDFNSGLLEDLKSLAGSLSISGKVTWTGHMSPNEEFGSMHLKAADVCVLPFDEGVRLNNSSFAVAASHELPIITTSGASQDSVFATLENVLLCPPKKPNVLADVISRVARDKTLLGQMSEESARLSRDWFSWACAIDRTAAALGTADTALTELNTPLYDRSNTIRNHLRT